MGFLEIIYHAWKDIFVCAEAIIPYRSLVQLVSIFLYMIYIVFEKEFSTLGFRLIITLMWGFFTTLTHHSCMLKWQLFTNCST